MPLCAICKQTKHQVPLRTSRTIVVVRTAYSKHVSIRTSSVPSSAGSARRRRPRYKLRPPASPTPHTVHISVARETPPPRPRRKYVRALPPPLPRHALATRRGLVLTAASRAARPIVAVATAGAVVWPTPLASCGPAPTEATRGMSLNVLHVRSLSMGKRLAAAAPSPPPDTHGRLHASCMSHRVLVDPVARHTNAGNTGGGPCPRVWSSSPWPAVSLPAPAVRRQRSPSSVWSGRPGSTQLMGKRQRIRCVGACSASACTPHRRYPLDATPSMAVHAGGHRALSVVC
jgi:hypothetical protein